MSNKATPKMQQAARRALATAACAGLLILALFGSSAQASRTPYSTNLYSGPSYYTSIIGGTLPGSYVAMVCWTDSSVWAYGSNRWFYVAGYGFIFSNGRIGGISGFAPANRVAEQTRVPHC
jgi:hypothetical protein